MNNTIKVILNPYAGRWKAMKLRSLAEKALKNAGLDFDLEATDGPRHGIELARNAVKEGYQTIVSAGGDGSISEVINGVMQSIDNVQPPPRIGLLPLGSANDLVTNLGLPLDLDRSAMVIASGKVKTMDLGQITYLDNDENASKTHYFDNNSAIGLEPTITLIQERIHFIHGSPRYLFAALVGIVRNPQWSMHLEWDDGSYDGPVTLVTVGNHPLTGGVFYMTPHADGFDDLLTFVYGSITSRRRILSILPRAMKGGEDSYINEPNIHEIHTKCLQITTDQKTALHADGEIQSKNVNKIEYRVIPKAIQVLA